MRHPAPPRCATVIEYGIMYGQNITPRLRKAAMKKSTVIANGTPSWRLRWTPTASAASASTPIAGKTRPQCRVCKSLRASTL